jgi:hypothetical protein
LTEITSPSDSGSDLAEQPTAAARLSISLRPSGVTAEATVPTNQVQTVITMSWMVIMGVAGISGAVLILRAGPQRGLAAVWLALADLVLTLVIVILTAAHGRPARREILMEAPHDDSLGKTHAANLFSTGK